MAPPARQVFGQTMHKKKKGRSNYQRQFGGGGGHKSNPATVYRSGGGDDDAQQQSKSEKAAEYRRQKIETAKQVEAHFGIERFVLADNQQVAERRGWLYNLVPTTVRLGFLLGSICENGTTQYNTDLSSFYHVLKNQIIYYR